MKIEKIKTLSFLEFVPSYSVMLVKRSKDLQHIDTPESGPSMCLLDCQAACLATPPPFPSIFNGINFRTAHAPEKAAFKTERQRKMKMKCFVSVCLFFCLSVFLSQNLYSPWPWEAPYTRNGGSTFSA